MKIKHADLIVDFNKPFENCKLGREKYASILTDIVSDYADGFVLAINGRWGTGKTTFVRMWDQHLKNKDFKTLYFNAWETDFEDNPLVALIAEFKQLSKEGDTKKFDSMLKKGAVLAKSIAPQIFRAAIESYGVTKAIAEVIENTTKGATEILSDEIDDYNKKKNSIEEFKNCLKEFVESVTTTNPIIFIIDELDRCRPNYAVSLLEQIKHLFSVPGIVFVLSIDKDQLGNAVRGVYGSDRINADEYLRRFIDLEYLIPDPETKQFVIYMYQYFGIGAILLSEERKKIQEFWYEPDAFVNIATLLFDKNNLSLRQQEKIFAHARIGLRSLQWNQYLFPSLFIFLIYLRNHHEEVYRRVHSKIYTTQDVLDEFYKIFPKSYDEETKYLVEELEALLAYMYDNYINETGRYDSLIRKDKTTDVESLIVKPYFDGSSDFSGFLNHIRKFRSKYDSRAITIKKVLNRIDLVNAVA